MQQMIFGSVLTFEQIMSTLEALELEINGILTPAPPTTTGHPSQTEPLPPAPSPLPHPPTAHALVWAPIP
jgi:hypothetical protein